MTKGNTVATKKLMEIAQRAISTRLAQNISQIDLAKNSGISRIVIQRLEAGRGCTLENLIRIMSTLSQIDQADHIFPAYEIKSQTLRKKAGKTKVTA